MELTPSLVEERAREYRENEPLYDVEREHLEMLPDAFEAGEYGWRDAEWVVQWYFRRYLGAYPNADRREAEAAYGENDFEDVLDALAAAGSAEREAAAVRQVTRLEGVDARVASAFLHFMSPDRYVVVGDREWTVLRAVGELDEPYPDPPDVEEYLAYLETCRSVADELGVDLVTLHRVLWRLWNDVERDGDT